MNLHPRDGVRYFEQQYPDMARACGVDPQTKRTIEFDLTDEKFRNAYFDILHHPYEKWEWILVDRLAARHEVQDEGA